MITDLRKTASDLRLADIGVAPAIPEVRNIYPWACSVVTAAICYLPPEQTIPDEKPRGVVARIARSADYHTVLRAKLNILADQIKLAAPIAQVDICVDTTPIPERKLAVLSGIAARAKNGNVFVEGCGSYAALGGVVTDIELFSGKPLEADICGDCDLCIKACPARAIISPGIIDRSKCVSALTQSSGPIPLDLREKMGKQIYGCDACQEVCPHNRNIKSVASEFAEDVLPGAYPEIIPLITMSEQDFQDNVKNSSIGWIGRARIRRNAIIAAGNLHCEDTVSVLKEVTRGESAMLSEYSVWAIGNCITNKQD
jgi:epoxyqueuosine reductase